MCGEAQYRPPHGLPVKIANIQHLVRTQGGVNWRLVAMLVDCLPDDVQGPSPAKLSWPCDRGRTRNMQELRSRAHSKPAQSHRDNSAADEELIARCDKLQKLGLLARIFPRG